jgi:hypothetical protein
MDGDGYDFFSLESAVGDTWAATASGHGGGAPLRGGFEDFDPNSMVADNFPNIGEYGAFLQGDADQPLGRSRSSGLPPQPPLRASRSLGVSTSVPEVVLDGVVERHRAPVISTSVLHPRWQLVAEHTTSSHQWVQLQLPAYTSTQPRRHQLVAVLPAPTPRGVETVAHADV